MVKEEKKGAGVNREIEWRASMPVRAGDLSEGWCNSGIGGWKPSGGREDK
jgi:hypothetical protein